MAPIAHYHMGGIRVDQRMVTRVAGLYAAGEAVGGANGANRLSGNAITEALAFGRAAGRSAAELLAGPAFEPAAAGSALALAAARGGSCNTAALMVRLQAVMSDHVGPFRSAAGLRTALDSVRALRVEMGAAPPGRPRPHDLARVDWFNSRHCRAGRAVAVKDSLRGRHGRSAPLGQHSVLERDRLRLPRNARQPQT